MTKEKDSTIDERITWGEGDLQFLGPDGKPISFAKLKEMADAREAAGVAEGPPTLHLYLPGEK